MYVPWHMVQLGCGSDDCAMAGVTTNKPSKPNIIMRMDIPRQILTTRHLPSVEDGHQDGVCRSGVQAVKEKQHQQDDDHQAQHAAQSGAAIISVGVVTAAAAKQKQKNHDNQ